MCTVATNSFMMMGSRLDDDCVVHVEEAGVAGHK